jgi:hypothetical protein
LKKIDCLGNDSQFRENKKPVSKYEDRSSRLQRDNFYENPERFSQKLGGK